MKRKKEKNEKIFEIGYKSNNAICVLSKLLREGKESITDDDIEVLEEMSELFNKVIEGKEFLDEMGSKHKKDDSSITRTAAKHFFIEGTNVVGIIDDIEEEFKERWKEFKRKGG